MHSLIYTNTMNNKFLSLIQKHEVEAAYMYTHTPAHIIPVLIAENVDDWFVRDLRTLSIENSIFLTIEDLMRGEDVFGVVLLHILARSTPVYGDNILQSMKYDHAQIRTSLEAHLRHFLIDLREQIVAWNDWSAIKQKLIGTCDRIRCGLHWYLNGKKILTFDDIEAFLDDLDHDWSCDLWWLWAVINSWEIELMAVHNTLLGLLHKIDTMDQNRIK